MKEGWSYKKLGEVARVIHGKNQKEVLSENGQYPILGSGGTIMGYANDFLCEARTTILGRKGTINNPQFIEKRFWNVDTAFGITAQPGNDSKFIYYFVKSIDWSKKNTGTTLPSLTQQVVTSVEIPVPPLSEQRSIVTRLDAAFSHIDALKANAEKQLNEARKLFQAELTECMKPKEGWEEKKLGDVARVQNGFAFDSKLFNENAEGTPLIRIRDIKRSYTNTYTTENCSSDFVIEDGDVLIGMDGDFNICVWMGGHAYLNQRVCHVVPTDAILSRFIYYYLPFPLKRINDKTAFSTVKHLSSKQVNGILIPVPSLQNQQTIVSHLDSLSSHIRKLEELQQKTIAECDALKQAMLREVFE